MTSIQPYLDVPQFIVEGLGNGSMFRTGGVIQNSANGQIIAWLRENGASVGIPAPLLQSQSGAAGVFGNVMGIVGGVTLLNLAISGAAIVLLNKRLEKALDEIVREFWRDRMAKHDAALRQFFNAVHVTRAENRQQLLLESLTGLTETEMTVVSRIKELQRRGLFAKAMTERQMREAYYFHLMCMNVYKMIALCFFELGELEMACASLEEAVERHERNVRDFVSRSKVPDSISQNLIRELEGNNHSLKQISDFSLMQRDFDNFSSSDHGSTVAISLVYGIVESFDRLRGMSMALAALDITYFDWERFEAAKHDGYLTFIDMDRVSRWQKLRGLGRRAKRAKNRR